MEGREVGEGKRGGAGDQTKRGRREGWWGE